MNPSQFHSNRKPYNWLIYKNYDRFLKKESNHYRGTLYDLGCGEAPYKQFFLQYAKHYIGVDWTDTIHDTKADVVADLNKPLPLESNVADTVVSLSTMEHLCEPQMMLSEAYRILKPGCYIVLQVPWQWWVHERPCDFFRYTPYGLMYMFEKAGFVDVVVEPEAGFFTMWVLKLNYFSLRFIRGPKPMRGLIKAGLLPFWYIGQTLAPLLDKLDRNWALETSGYFVIANKLYVAQKESHK
jgi:SAM-dependent methyltransferase